MAMNILGANAKNLYHPLLRGVILVSFFNFSGLNNSIVTLAGSASAMNQFNFAPTLVRHLTKIHRPGSWGKKQIATLLNRSFIILNCSSRQILRDLSMETHVVRQWLAPAKFLNQPHNNFYSSAKFNRINEIRPLASLIASIHYRSAKYDELRFEVLNKVKPLENAL